MYYNIIYSLSSARAPKEDTTPQEFTETVTVEKLQTTVEHVIDEKVEETVPIAPVFTQTLQSQDVTEGMPASFECTVTGTPQPEIKWYQVSNLAKRVSVHQ